MRALRKAKQKVNSKYLLKWKMKDDICYMVILYKVCINNGPGMTAEQVDRTDFQDELE